MCVCVCVCQHVYLCLEDVNMSTISPMYQSWCQFVFCCCWVRWLKAQINTLDPTWSSYTDWTHPNLIVSSRSYLFQGIIFHIHYPLSLLNFNRATGSPCHPYTAYPEKKEAPPSDGCFFKKHPHLLQEKPCEQERHANTVCLHNKVARNLQFTPVDEPQTHWESAWMDAWKKLQTNQERRLAQKPKPSSKWHESDVFFFNGKLY